MTRAWIRAEFAKTPHVSKCFRLVYPSLADALIRVRSFLGEAVRFQESFAPSSASHFVLLRRKVLVGSVGPFKPCECMR